MLKKWHRSKKCVGNHLKVREKDQTYSFSMNNKDKRQVSFERVTTTKPPEYSSRVTSQLYACFVFPVFLSH
jgi:hypothetical protein